MMTSRLGRRQNEPKRGRLVVQDTLTLSGLMELLKAFETENPPAAGNPDDQWVYVVQSVTGSPMAALMLSPTKAGDD
jgi:hypothetical protein